MVDATRQCTINPSYPRQKAGPHMIHMYDTHVWYNTYANRLAVHRDTRVPSSTADLQLNVHLIEMPLYMSGLIYLIPRRGFAQSKHSDGGSGSQGRGAGSNTGAEKLFYQKSCFSWVFPMKIKKYFGHKLIKNPSKINFSTIFWKLLSGSIRMTHPLFTICIKKY